MKLRRLLRSLHPGLLWYRFNRWLFPRYPEPPPWPTCCGRPMDACHPERIMRCSACGASETNSYYLPDADRALLAELARLNRWIKEEPTTEKEATCRGCGLRHSDEPSVRPRADGHARCNDCEAKAARTPTEAEREILAEFNGVELQQGAAAEQECAAATSLLAEYQRQARTWTGRQEDAR